MKPRNLPGQIIGLIRPRFSLYWKYVLFIGLVTFAMLFGSALFYVHLARVEAASGRVHLQEERSVAIAADIRDYVHDIVDWISWTTMPLDGDGNPSQQRYLDFVRLLHLVDEVTDIRWLDLQGRERLHVSRDGVTVRESRRSFADPGALDGAFTGALSKAGAEPARNLSADRGRGPRAYFGGVYFTNQTEPHMRIAYTVYGRSGGVSVADIGLWKIRSVIDRTPLSKSHMVYVVDRGGVVISHPDADVVRRNTREADLEGALVRHVDNRLEDPFLLRALRLLLPEAGRENVTGRAKVPGVGWEVVVRVSEEEAYAPLVRTAESTGAILLLGLVVSTLLSFLLANHMVQPIREIQRGALRLGRGEFDQPIGVRSGDELGSLALQLNGVAEQLSETRAMFEQRVENRTQDLREALRSEAAAAQVLRMIAKSPADPAAAFALIVESTLEACDARQVWLARTSGDMLEGVAGAGAPFPGRHEGGVFVVNLDRETLTGRAVLDKEVIQVADVSEGTLPAAARNYCDSVGLRSITAVPLMSGDQVLGALVIGGRAAGSLRDRQLALVRVFADLAVIAVDSAKRFHELRDKTLQLEHANHHKSEFLANMSHELRTPLNAVMGFAQMLRRPKIGPLNPKQAEYVDDIYTSGRHLLYLINDILDLSKIEAGKMELLVTEFDLAGVLSETIAMMQERAQSHGIKLESALDSGLGAFVGDERKLKQILLNLLSNAIKFTPEGGRIDVTARPVDDGVEVSVSDTGIGIPEVDQPKVWAEFMQVGGDHARKAQGTGLGLTLVRKFVELHGGRIWLESVQGTGTTFTFRLRQQTRSGNEGTA